MRNLRGEMGREERAAHRPRATATMHDAIRPPATENSVIYIHYKAAICHLSASAALGLSAVCSCATVSDLACIVAQIPQA